MVRSNETYGNHSIFRIPHLCDLVAEHVEVFAFIVANARSRNDHVSEAGVLLELPDVGDAASDAADNHMIHVLERSCEEQAHRNKKCASNTCLSHSLTSQAGSWAQYIQIALTCYITRGKQKMRKKKKKVKK